MKNIYIFIESGFFNEMGEVISEIFKEAIVLFTEKNIRQKLLES